MTTADRLFAPTPTMSDLIAARLTFLRERRFEDYIAEPVRQSWLRSAAHGVDAHAVRPQTLEQRRLAEARSRSGPLLEAAERSLQVIHQTLGQEPHMAALSDPDGLIVRLLAPRGAIGPGLASNLFEGASWHERDIGSNGIGTAIATEDAVTILGPQHFADDYMPWTCIGVPLHHPGGRLAGALDVSVRNERSSSQTLGWTLSVAEKIETALARTSAARRIDDALDPARLERTVGELLDEQRRLEEWDRRKDSALASLSHELRNPLNVLEMLVDLAQRVAGDPVRFGEIAARLRRQTRRLTRLVADIGDVVAVKRGALVVRAERVDFNEIARQATEATRPEVERLGHKLIVSLSPAPLPVDGDPDRLEQVLTNLLTNAAKYTPAGGVVEIESEASAGTAVVRVRDSGHGIASEDLSHIFDEYSRVVPPGADPGGMGLGLTLVKNLVRLHHGTVTPRSEGPGRGSEFEVRLPLRA